MADIAKKKLLIERNLNETLGSEPLEDVLKERNLRIFWGTAPTGKPHLAYFVPIIKISDFVKADCEVTILIANNHAFLDSRKTPQNLLEARSKFYEHILTLMLKPIDVDLNKIKFIRGSEFQYKQDYINDFYELSSLIPVRECLKASSEIVKKSDKQLLSNIMYPVLQILDEEYLHSDAQLGGVDQRKIFVLAEKYLPKIGYSKRIHLMNSMVGGLQGDKMSASNETSKIDILDSTEIVEKKLLKAFCEPGNTEKNTVLSIAKLIIFPLLKEGENFTVITNHEEQLFLKFTDLEEAFSKQRVHPQALKLAVSVAINKILDPIRNNTKCPEFQLLLKQAYDCS